MCAQIDGCLTALLLRMCLAVTARVLLSPLPSTAVFAWLLLLLILLHVCGCYISMF